MKKRNMIFLMAAMLCLLSACGKETDVDTNTVIIEKKGQITEAIVEDFEQPYYDQEELKREIEDKISQFNTQSGDGKEAVELEKFESLFPTVMPIHLLMKSSCLQERLRMYTQEDILSHR